MLKHMRVAMLAPAVLIVAVGCASPTPEELVIVQQERDRVAVLLSDFVKAIADKSPEKADRLLSPHLMPFQRLRLRQVIGEVTWLELYSGYDFEIPATVDRLWWRRLMDGRVRFKVKAHNARGVRYKDKFWLDRVNPGEWRISDLQLQRPEFGEEADPPAEETERIRAAVGEIMALLKAGKPERVYYLVTNRKSGGEGGSEKGLRRMYLSLRSLKDITVLQWPDLATEMRLGYGGLHIIIAGVSLVYTWPEENVFRPERVGIAIRLMRQEDEWVPFDIRID